MSDPLDGPRRKIERAKKHIQELRLELQAFFDTRPYVVGTKRSPETRQLIYYLIDVRQTPAMIPVIAGEVLQNFRSALDHLAYQLVLIGTGQPGPFPHVYFPIFDSAEKYEAGKMRQIRGMRQEAIDALDALKPYGGGNEVLWRIHRLNNVDKHRLLITVGSAFTGLDIAPHMMSLVAKTLPKDFEGIPVLPAIFLRPADRLFPLKAGDELFIDHPDAEVNEQTQFRFDVALSETGIVEGEPLIKALEEMSDTVDSLFPAFAPLVD